MSTLYGFFSMGIRVVVALVIGYLILFLSTAFVVGSWWFGAACTSNAEVMQRYHVSLWSVPNDLFTEQTVFMASHWIFVGITFLVSLVLSYRLAEELIALYANWLEISKK